MTNFSVEVEALENEMIAWRRHLHANPELSFQETETSNFIAQQLASFGGIEILRPTATGVIGRVLGLQAGPGRVIGIRGDIDALPLREENDLPYRSTRPNVMHACGHDGHTAMLLGLAKLLSTKRADFPGEVRLVFQHAEELPPGGAVELVRAGAVEGVDLMLGLHLSTNYNLGTFGIKSGVLTAAVDRFDITLSGKGGHCAYPEQCADPLLALAHLIVALQTIVSRRVPPEEQAVVSVCAANAGSAYNIIPDTAHLSASVRSFSPGTRRLVEEEVYRIANGVAQGMGVEAEVLYQLGYPSVVNDLALTSLAEEVILQRFGESHLEHIGTIMPGEDFSYFTENRPGFFVELGSRNPGNQCDQPHHNPHYRLDESALKYGLQYLTDMVFALLEVPEVISN